MAKQPSPFSPAFIESVSGRDVSPVKAKPAQKPAAKPVTKASAKAPAKPAARPSATPSAGIGLMPNYASVFKPFVGESVVNQEERNALDNLFQIQTGGGTVVDQPDVHEALKAAGVLRFPTVGKTLKGLRDKRSPTYASAVDAIDALDRVGSAGKKTDYVGDAKREPITKGLLAPITQPAPVEGFWKTALSMGVLPIAEDYVLPALGKIGEIDPVGKATAAYKAAIEEKHPEVLAPGGPSFTSVLGKYKGAIEAKHPEVGGPGGKPVSEVAKSGLGAYRERVLAKNPYLKKDVGGTPFSELPAGTFANLFSPLTDDEKKRVREMGGQVYGSGRLGGMFEVYRVPGYTVGDLASKGGPLGGLEPVSSASAKLTREQLIQRQANERAAAAMAEFLDAAQRHESSVDIQAKQEQSGLGPLSRQDRVDLLKMAKENGWDISRPRKYTDAELARRAFTRVNPVEEIRTGLLRQTGQLASLPAFLASAVESAVDTAQGDPEGAKQIVKSFFAPYTYVADDADRRGLGPAIAAFVQERPLDAVLLANGVGRGVGRGVGVAGRTVGGTGRYAAQVAVSQALENRGFLKPGGVLARFGEYSRTDRPVGVSVSGVEKYLGERPGAVEAVDQTLPQAYQLPVGYTSANIFDTIALGAKAWLIDRGLKSGSDLSKWAATRRADRALRSIYTKRDAATADATRALREIGASLTPGQRERLTMELIRSTADEGTSLDAVAAFWRDRAAQKFVDAENPDLAASRVKNRADARLYSRMSAEYEKWAKTELDPQIIQQARDAMRSLGKDNDIYISAVIDSLSDEADSRGVKRIGEITDDSGVTRPLTFGDLRPGDYVDVGRGGRVEPALLTDVRLNADGSVEFTRQNLMNPMDVRRVTAPSSKRTVKLSSGATKQKYVRDFILLQDQFDQAARVMKETRTAESRAEAVEFNRPINEWEKLDQKRLALGREIEKRLASMQDARVAGRQGDVRKFARQYAMRAYALRETLVQMERLANEAGFVDAAAQLRGWLDRIVIERGDLGGVSALRVADRAMREQDGVVAAIRSGEMAPVVARRIDQPVAGALVENAQRLEARAAELRALEERLVAERDAAPSAAVAGAAARQLDTVRAEIDSLVQQAGSLRRVPSGFVGALDALEKRFEYVTGAGTRSLMSGKGKYGEVVAAERPELLGVLGELRRKVEDGVQITKDDIAALRDAEARIVSIERRVAKSKSYKARDKSIVEPDGFGRKTVGERVDVGVSKELVGAAFERGARLDELQARVTAREAAPSVASLREVRRVRKAALRQAELNRREAARIVERGRPIVNDAHTKVVLDAATGEIAVELPSRLKPTVFKIEEMRNEARNEFVARAEMSGDDAVLFLGTRAGRFGAKKRGYATTGQIDLAPGAGIRRGRLFENQGFVYGNGYEDFSNLWSRLLFDSGSLKGNAVWLVEMRKFIEGISIRVDNMGEAEAAAYNATRGAVANLSEGERVVFDARRWVAVSANRDAPISSTVKTGSIDLDQALSDLTDPSLADVFKQQASIENVVAAGGDYYLIPEFLYNQIIDELGRIQYRPSGAIKVLDDVTKQWRSFTLNIFPRTAFANLVGSGVLAALAGAGPRSFYLAYRHLKYGDVPGPSQLRQGYAAGLTSEMQFARIREALPKGTVGLPGTARQVSFDTPFSGLAWWMNTMRTFNGITEDFGRLAVWYSKAYPEASRLADESFVTRWTRGRELSEEAQGVLDALARGDDPAISALSERFVDRSFEWLGDLHAGGKLNTVFRIAVPFQQWYRHIVRLTLVTMPLKYPGRMLFLSRLADIGREYLVQHGVYPGWMMDVIPILVDEKMIDGVPQEYILAWRGGAANPFGTPAGAVMGEDQQFADWGAGMLNPMWRGLAEIVYGGLTGKARRMGGEGAGFEKVKNQANNEINTWSSDGGTYYLNTIIRMLPLSSMAVTSAGQSAEGNLLLGGSPKLLRGSEGFLPAYALPPDTPGRDLRQLFTEFSWWNAVSFGTRTMVGGAPTYVIGRGPVMDSQFGATMDRYRAAYKSSMSNIEKSSYQLSQTEAPAQVVPSAPVETPPSAPPSAPTRTVTQAPFFGSLISPTTNK